MTIPGLKPCRSLSGHDAYCHVCWNPVYVLWIDREDDPAGRCLECKHRAQDCSDAMARARFAGQMAQLKREGCCEPPEARLARWADRLMHLSLALAALSVVSVLATAARMAGRV